MPDTFAKRAQETEIMDDFSLEGEELIHTLDDLRRVNKWLGGNGIVISGIQQILADKHFSTKRPIRIADLGCGGGDSLLALAKWGSQTGQQVSLTGIDANTATIAYAQEQARTLKNVLFRVGDVLQESCQIGDHDIVILGLFLHHLTEAEQIQLIQKCLASGARAILINDLQRSKLAYRLFQIISRIFNFSAMSRHDGALSIRKGFQKPELTSLMNVCGIKSYSLKWKWAFRYQVIALIP